MIKIQIKYPSEAEELEVMRRSAHKADVTIDRVVSPEDITRVSDAIRKVPISDEVMRYALRLVRTTRVAGATHATHEHVREVAVPVLRHRVLLNFNAEADQVTAEGVIRGLIEGVPTEESPEAVRAQMDDVYQ